VKGQQTEKKKQKYLNATPPLPMPATLLSESSITTSPEGTYTARSHGLCGLGVGRYRSGDGDGISLNAATVYHRDPQEGGI